MKACLAIGVDKVDQAGTLAVLQDAAAGAERFYNWALAEGYDSKLLTDRTGPVTTALIKAEIRAFVNRGIYDQLLVYFAGHGILKSAYWEQWLLTDANSDPNEAVNLESSIKYARNSRIPHLVFVSDACRSLTTDPNLSQVDGSIIFPTKPPQRTQKRPEVDTFYATAPGDTSLEVPAPQASGAYRALFTEVLLKGLSAPDSSLTEFVTDPQSGRIEVVSSRTLKPYLIKEVPNAATAVNITLNQMPELNVESQPPSYLAVVKAPPPGPAVGFQTPPAPPTPPAPAQQLRRLAEGYGLGHFFAPEVETRALPVLPTDPRFHSDMQRIMDLHGRPSFETQTGFTVIGAGVTSAVYNRGNSDILNEPGVTGLSVRVWPSDAARSILLEFAEGSGTCLAVLPGFVGTVVVEQGVVTNVNYTMAASNPLYFEYAGMRDEIEKRRAFAAVAARRGYFRVDRDKAPQFSGYLRELKAFDPTLGLYAAYGYSQADLLDELDSVFDYMKGKYPLPVLFDVAMLANRLEAESWKARANNPPEVAPFCPMLTQGWAYLGEEVPVPSVVREAARYLVPSLWTTLTPRGVDLLKGQLMNGDLQ